jgi:Tfp pilus assembly protein PilN
MTTTLPRSARPWVVQPGWGIHVDLTPQELVTTRQVRVLRKLVVSALVAIFLLVAGGWFLAYRSHSAAEDDLSRAQIASSALAAKANQPAYTNVTAIQNALDQAKGQLSGLMKGDVLLDRLAGQIAAALPKGAAYNTVSVSVSAVGVNAQQATTPSVTPDNGHQRVGDVGLAGTAASVDDVSRLVEHLQAVPGLIDVVPTSSTKQDGGAVRFQITLGLDDRVLSHRFDVKAGK